MLPSGQARSVRCDAQGSGHPQLHPVVPHRHLLQPRLQAGREDYAPEGHAQLQPQCPQAVRPGGQAQENLLSPLHRSVEELKPTVHCNGIQYVTHLHMSTHRYTLKLWTTEETFTFLSLSLIFCYYDIGLREEYEHKFQQFIPADYVNHFLSLLN